MDAATRQKAVNEARANLQGGLRAYLVSEDGPLANRMAAARAREWMAIHGLKPDNLDNEAVASLIEASASDPDAYDFCKGIAADRIYRGKPLPESLAEFAAGVLLETLPKPRQKTGPKYQHRDFNIWRVSHGIAFMYDLPLYGEHLEVSAADIVAEAAGRSLSRVVRIIQEWNQILPLPRRQN